MKKFGFTLAELLIVLGITGVIASIILASVSYLMPDKTKIMYLKVHKELIEGVKDLSANSSIYPVTIEINNKDYDVSKYPLLNINKPILKNLNKDEYSNNKKICNLLAFSMNAADNKCNDNSQEYSDSAFNTNKSFTTPNGVEWWIVPKVYQTSAGKASYQTDIYVDVDSSKKSPNCLFSANCKQPDRFKFLLAANGAIIPADPMGLKYLDTQKSWIKRKYDVDGNILASLDDSLLNLELEEAYVPVVEQPVLPTDPSTPTTSTEPKDEDDPDVRLACGDNFDYGDNWIKYTIYPVTDRLFYREQLYSPDAFSFRDMHNPIDISVQIKKPLKADLTATIGLIRKGVDDSFGSFVVRQTCTIKAGNTSCSGAPLDKTRDLHLWKYYDYVYTYDFRHEGNAAKTDLTNFTYFYVSDYIDIKYGYPANESVERMAWRKQHNSTQKCIRIKRAKDSETYEDWKAWYKSFGSKGPSI